MGKLTVKSLYLTYDQKEEMSISIRKVQLPIDGFELLLQESLAEGHRFIQRLQEEWVSGSNRFSSEGEALYCAFDGTELVATGGLNQDPFLHSPEIGRIRRIYVRPSWRRRGIATALISILLRDAANHFLQVHLRTENPEAARLYEGMGFEPLVSPTATHIISFVNT